MEMIEACEISNILLKLREMEPNEEFISERIIASRQAVHSNVNISDTKNLYSHQEEALEILESEADIKALVLHTSTSSGKSLIYQVCIPLLLFLILVFL